MDHLDFTHHKFKVHKHHYFQGRLSSGFKHLLVNKLVINIGTALFSVFLPIFLYEVFGNSIRWVAVYYLASYVFCLLFVFFLSSSLSKFGFKRSLQTSTLIGAIYYLGLFFLKPDNVLFMVPVVVFAIALWRFLYWIPYNIDFAKFTTKKDRGKGIGLIEAILSITGVIAPIIAGFIIAKFSFNVLFLVGVFVFLLSFFPLKRIPRTKEDFSWSKKTFAKRLFSKKNRKLALFFYLDGAESILSCFVWPIFVYELLNGNYLEVGFISSFVVAATIIMQLVSGKLADKNKNKLIKTGGFLYSIGWLLKIFAVTAMHIFIFDAFHRFMKIFYRIPLDTLIFETAFKQKHLIDEFNVFRQFYIYLGRISMSGLVIALSFLISSINWIFSFGILIVLLISFFHKKIQSSTL